MINVRFSSMIFNANGYSEVGRRVGFTLAEMNNVRVNFIPIGGGAVFDSEIQEKFNKYNSVIQPAEAAINVTLMIPSYLKKSHRGPNILYTMIETGSVNHKFVHECNQADEIWVPSEWNRKILRDGGVTKPINVFPFGINLQQYDTKSKLFDSKSFNFLCIANWDERKGLETLIPAFLEEFRNDKNVKLILKVSYRARHGKTVDDYAKRTISQVTKLSAEQIEIISKPLSLYEIPQLYRSCHCFVLATYGEGFCALPGQQVKTSIGYRNIEDISVGEKVINRLGKVDTVVEIKVRNIQDKVLRIKTSRINLNLEITKEHPVYCIQDTSCKLKESWKNANLPRFCRKDCKQPYCRFKNNTTNTPNWLNAENLTKNSVLTYPRYKYQENNLVIDLLDFTEYYRNENNKHIEINRDKKFTRFITVDKDLCRLLGYYLAEGHLAEDAGFIGFTFNSKEIEYIEDVKNLINKIFNSDKFYNEPIWIEGTKNTFGTICFYNKTVVQLFKYLGGKYSHHKKMIDWFKTLPTDLIKQILIGYVRGDGHIVDNGRGLEIRTVSKNLAFDVFDLFLRLDVIPSLNYFANDKGFSKNGMIYSVKAGGSKICSIFEKEFNLTICRKKKSGRGWMDEDFLYIPIEDIEEINYSGNVYNLEVKDDNSFVLEGAVVHNCLPALECLATRTPIITTRFGAHLDFLNDSNSYLINCEKRTAPLLNKISSYYANQLWGVPNKDHLKSLMRHVYQNYNEACEKAKLGYEQCKKFDLKSVIIPIYQRLEEICGNGYFLTPQQITKAAEIIQPTKFINKPVPQRPRVLFNSMNTELQKKVTTPLKYNLSSV